MTMQATKGRLYGKKRHLACIGGQTRAVWNHFLSLNIETYKTTGNFAFYKEMASLLTGLLKSDPRLVGCGHRPAQMMVQRLDRTLRDFLKAKRNPKLKRMGFPRFKKQSDRRDSFSFVGSEVRLDDEQRHIRLPKLGWLRVRGLNLPDTAVIKQAVVTQQPTGWDISLQFDAHTKSYAVPSEPMVGIDMGLAALVTLSGGEVVEHQRFARKAAKSIRRLNRERDRRRKGSVNRERTVKRLGKLHRYVRNQRHDFIHKATYALVQKYAGFAVETLNVSGLMRTRMAASLGDAAWGLFLQTLKYKATWAGRGWYEHPPFARGTGVCPDCSHVGPKLALSIREWVCDGCGVVHDRDAAAARYVLACAVGAASPEPVPGNEGQKRGAAALVGEEQSSRSSGSPSNDQITHLERAFEGLIP